MHIAIQPLFTNVMEQERIAMEFCVLVKDTRFVHIAIQPLFTNIREKERITMELCVLVKDTGYCTHSSVLT